MPTILFNNQRRTTRTRAVEKQPQAIGFPTTVRVIRKADISPEMREEKQARITELRDEWNVHSERWREQLDRNLDEFQEIFGGTK